MGQSPGPPTPVRMVLGLDRAVRARMGAEVRVALVGTRSFGVRALQMIQEEGHEVTWVFAPMNDKLLIEAARQGITRWTGLEYPERLVDTDVLVAAHSHEYIGQRSRAATRLGVIGYHPSLLPRHRGRDAVEWTIRMGDPIAGGSVYWFGRGVDTGDVAAQDWCFVRKGETASELWRDKLFPMGIDLLRGALHDLNSGIIRRQEQNPAYATWEPKVDAPSLERTELTAIGPPPTGYQVVGSRQR